MAAKNGRRLGKIPASNIRFKDCMNSKSELAFAVNKSNVSKKSFWEGIRDFKLVWAREWNTLFEMYVTLDDSDGVTKSVSAYSLGEVELSQIRLRGIEVNTESDIEREDYVPTVLFDSENTKRSLVHRILEKAPHYRIGHVDFSIADIQRTFQFSDKTIYDAMQEISTEINCLFEINCYYDSEWNIVREINVYDMESYCFDCGKRGNFRSSCDNCGSENINRGYGNDTTILVSKDNLADGITYETDEGSVKNCFMLEAGDDLMTATIANCNPNGSGYIWYISDAMKSDMSDELVAKLNQYDELYSYYQTEHNSEFDGDLIDEYNGIVDKYNDDAFRYKRVHSPIVGYPALMQSHYDVIDLGLYLQSSMMPDVGLHNFSASEQAVKLNALNNTAVAIQNTNSFSESTVNNAVLGIAKTIVDTTRYQVKVLDSVVTGLLWVGTISVTNYSNEEDFAQTEQIVIQINDNYEEFVRQKIEKTISKNFDGVTDVVSLFDLSEEDFEQELKKYSLSRLNSFADVCQGCLDVLIEQGIADRESWENTEPNLYLEMYLPYYNKLAIIHAEEKIRESEIVAINSMLEAIEKERTKIQSELNFENFIGRDLWLEFSAFRREDTYQNSNYVSDGLNNAELFDNAMKFIEVAKKEIVKSATLQHSISASLRNLLVMKEFEAITDSFNVGNWIRVKIDGEIYILRILDYEINFDDLSSLTVTFSDVKMSGDDIADDTESVLNQAASMASSYDSVARQAEKGNAGKELLNDWVTKGLALTNMKIVGNADNQNVSWDSHGILCKEYLPLTDSYDDRQLKIINRGLYLTDDNWLTSRAGIGNFTFYNPETGQMEESYGVIADTLIGNLVLSEKVGVYNKDSSIVLGENGLIITADATAQSENSMAMTIRKKSLDSDGNEVFSDTMYLDNQGNLVLNGTIRINSSSNPDIGTLDELTDRSKFTEEAAKIVHDQIYGEDGVYSSIDRMYMTSVADMESMLDNYKADVGQYLNYDDNGLTLGASSSTFKTVIDNQRLAFMDGDSAAAFISNNRLFVPNAVIQQTLTLGNFFFSPRQDGGVSLVWQDD